MPPSAWQILWCTPIPHTPRPSRRARRRTSPRCGPRGPGGRRPRRGGSGRGRVTPSSAARSTTGDTAGRVESLDEVGERVHPARGREVGRQGERQLRVVDDRRRQHAEVPAGGLDAALGQPPDRRHLGAGVRRRDGDDGQPHSLATALAVPIAEPPPSARRQSASDSAAAEAAARATSTGTCMTTSVNRPASRSPRSAATSSAYVRSWLPDTSRTRVAPRCATSAPTRRREPHPEDHPARGGVVDELAHRHLTGPGARTSLPGGRRSARAGRRRGR